MARGRERKDSRWLIRFVANQSTASSQTTKAVKMHRQMNKAVAGTSAWLTVHLMAFADNMCPSCITKWNLSNPDEKEVSMLAKCPYFRGW